MKKIYTNKSLLFILIAICSFLTPVVTLAQTTVNLETTADTWMRQGYPTYNYGGATTLSTSPNTSSRQNSLYQWNLSTIPTSATVSAASITFYVTDVSTYDFSLYNMRRTWVEGTSNGTASSTSANWNTYNGSSTWSSGGAMSTSADRFDTDLWDATASTFGTSGSVTIPLNSSGIAAVQGWIASSSTNFGMTLQYMSTGTTADYWIVASRENASYAGPTLNITYSTPPTITTTGSLTTFSSAVGTPSAEQSYTVSGTNLTSGIVITAPADFEISTTSGGPFTTSVTLPQADGSVSTTTIYVRLTGSNAGAYSGNITHTSTGATTKNVAASGTVYVYYNLTVSATNGSVVLSPSGGSYASGTVVTLTATGNTGYVFGSWSGALTGSTNPTTITMDGDKAVTADFTVAPPWTAYNDCSGTTGGNTTAFTYTGTTTGLLKNYNTGANTSVTAAITYNGSINSGASNGAYSNSGTDAYSTFYGKANMAGVINYASSTGWYIDVTFTGLDAGKTYSFATTANRADATYTTRNSQFTISDITSATNASTSGVTVVSNESVAFCTGYNTVNGYVARWVNINPGVDGDFRVRINAYPFASEYYGYGPGVFMLSEEASTGPAITATASFGAFSTSPGVPSEPQTYTVSGTNLTSDISISAPEGYTISTDGTTYSSSLTLPQSGGTVGNTTIYARLFSAVEGTFSGDITHTSDDATTRNIAVSGTVSSSVTVSLVSTHDAYISGYNTTYNYGAQTYLRVTLGTSQQRGSLLKWDLSGIPSGATVTSASLRLNVSTAASATYNLYSMRRDWLEGTGAGSATGDGATWLTYNGTSSWGTDGAANISTDRFDTNLWGAGSTTFSTTGIKTVALNSDGMAVVQGWISGSQPNYGLTIQNYSTGSTDVQFSSNNYATEANRPTLVVTYSLSGGTSYTLSVGNDGHGTVNLSPAGGNYAENTVVTLTPVPSGGYSFSAWSGSNASDPVDNGNGTWSLTMNSNKSFTANFTALPVNLAPNQPVLLQPADNATGISTSPTLQITASDDNPSDALSISFFGRSAGTTTAGVDFTIALIPDPQNYATSYPAVYNSQTQWIVNNMTTSNIVFATALGDLVNTSTSALEFSRADAAFDILDAGNVPYSVSPGNHDMGGSSLWPTYFGTSRFSGKSWFGGSYDNYNTYSLFSASGNDFIMINLQYSPGTAILDWADALLKANPGRRGIVVQHDILNIDNSWVNQVSYNALRDNANMFMMLCGHMHSAIDGAAYVAGTGTDGHTIHIVQADYQDFTASGYLRLLRFSSSDDMIYMTTYSPYTSASITTSPDQMNLTYDLTNGTAVDYSLIGTVTGVTNGANASISWPGLSANSEYEWYSTVSDGSLTTNGSAWSFTTATYYTLTAGGDTHGSVTLNPAGGSYVNGTTVTLTPVPNTGYEFSSWSGTNAGDIINTAGIYTIVMNGNKAVTANFVQIQYTLTAGNDGNGSVTLSPPGGTYAVGSTITLTPVANTGYQFSSWTGANSGDILNTDGIYTIVMNGNKTVTANFVQQFTLTAGNDGNGTVTLGPAGGTYTSGTTVTLTPVPNSGYVFSSWSGDNASDIINTSGVYTIVMNGNKTVTANFVQQFTLAAGNDGNGTVTLGPAGGTYTIGTTVTLTPVAGAGYVFSSWSGDNASDIVNTSGVYTIVMNGNKTVIANFMQIQYTLTAGNDGNGTVTFNPAGGTYTIGTTVTLTPVPNSGYVFSSWSGDNAGDIVNTGGVYTIELNGNKTVIANFVQQFTLTTSNDGNGSVTLSPAGGTYTSGTTVTLTPVPNIGYVFGSWSGTNAVDIVRTSSVYTIVMNSNKVVQANFTVAENVALNKTATCQGNYLTGHDPSFANDADGTNESYWNGKGHPQWWKVDLGATYDISSIVVRNWVDGSRYYHYTIESSMDDITYSQVASKTNDNTAADQGDGFGLSITARYLKVNMLDNSENQDVHISDFRAYGVLNASYPVLSNVALNKTATCQGNYLTGHDPSSANDADGTNNSYWNGIGHPQWWEVDLGATYDISSIVVRNWVDGARYYHYTIESSMDDITFSQVASKTNDNTATNLGDVYNVTLTARYLRVIMLDNSENQDVHISDFRAYGILNASYPVLSNVALNKTATCQGNYLTGHDPSSANDADGTNNSYWNGIGHPQWWKVDLGATYDISSIVVRNWVDGSRYYQYNVEASLDDQSYTQIAARTNTDAATDQGDIYNVSSTARYLRVNMTYNSENADVHISDFRAYGILHSGSKGEGLDSEAMKQQDVKKTGEGETKLNVYPNPFRDQFTIRIDSPDEEIYDVSVIDMGGKTVWTMTKVPGNTDITLNTHLTKGMYFLKVNNIGKTMIRRIVKY
jgi:hypothetical protein